MPFPLFLALKYLRPKRSFISVVTVISVLGVVLGVAILVIVLSVMTGFDNMWRDKILSFRPHLMVQPLSGVLDDDESLSARVAAVPGVSGVSPVIETITLIQFAGRTTAPMLLGLDPARAGQVSLVSQYIERGTFDITGNRAVVGVDLAMRLGLTVGSRFLVHSPQNVMRNDEVYFPEELEVAGIFNLNMRDFDTGFILASLETLRALTGLDEGAQSLYVMTRDPFAFEAMSAAVRRAAGPGLLVRNWSEIDRLLFSALRTEKTMMFILLVFITIVAIFCVTNTLIVITVHKTNEIGLLKALGFSAGQIMTAFVLHGLMQCLAGIAIGIAAGMTVLHNLGGIVRALASINIEVFPKSIYGFDAIPWEASAAEIAWVAVFVMVFCTMSSILPARRAARLDPVEALRHE